MQLLTRALCGALAVAVFLAITGVAQAQTDKAEAPVRAGGTPNEPLNPQPEPPGVVAADEDVPGAVCQTCPPPTPSPPSGAPAPKRFEIEVNQVKVWKTEDYGWAGIQDEAYIKIDGQHAWGPWALEQGTYNLWSGELVRSFYYKVKLALYDDDWPDSDDFLGAWWIPVDNSTPAHQNYLDFTGSGAHYSIWYTIRPR